MPHVIEVMENTPLYTALDQLRNAHSFVVEKVIVAQDQLGTDIVGWGQKVKRLSIDLHGSPELIGKTSEKFVELINILATTERTLEALEWLAKRYGNLIVRECHPSTSDFEGGNDIVLVSDSGEVRVRCEVCDVVSDNAGQNNKEKTDLRNLNCVEYVPSDGVDRYIATSSEFAAALTNQKRRWSAKHYHYEPIATGLSQDTVMLKLKPNK